MERVYIDIDYNINNNVKDVKKIIDIQNQIIMGNDKEYVIRFGQCYFLNAAVSVLIGTIPVYAQLYGKKVYIGFREKGSPVFEFMKSVGMYDFFNNQGISSTYVKPRALPFDRITNEDMMVSYTDKIISLAPINMNEKASDILSSYFYEIYQNSFSHSNSQIDVFSCGYWMRQQLVFSIYDMGVGIPYNVRSNIDEEMTSIQCVEWAFEEGNTTLEETFVKRGLGLSRLEQFIQLNDGSMAMYTDNVCYTVEKNKKEISELNVPIKGTLIIIKIKADNQHTYVVK